ncbi:succinate dehydrogenase assembly factor 2 [Bermanella sp. R86510]|uniref:FAD assembly factor SdhE n=1 Tax=unclassified Bermanella TaxID=2627862 RepID=UPI0037C59B7C
MTPEELATEKKRLWWHSRRGMLELDVLLLPFLEEAYDDLDEDDKARYRSLLDVEDPELFTWFMQTSKPSDPDHAKIVNIILRRVQPD